jgi:hypothetical protein
VLLLYQIKRSDNIVITMTKRKNPDKIGIRSPVVLAGNLLQVEGNQMKALSICYCADTACGLGRGSSGPSE